MNRVTFTFNNQTWTAFLYDYGVLQGETGMGSHGDPRFKRVKLTLQYDNDEDLRNALFQWAKSPKKKFDAKLDFYEAGQIVRTITFANAECVDMTESGNFFPNNAGAGMLQLIELFVKNVQHS